MTAVVRPELAADSSAVDRLVADAFGPGRFAKSAYRLREGVNAIAALGFVVELEGRIAGTVRYWPVSISGMPAIMLGPIAIRADLQGQGFALKLMQESLARALELGHRIVVLVGDEAYYARAGFARIQPAGRIVMPGPVDLNRLLGLELVAGALAGVSGELGKPAQDDPCHALGARLSPFTSPAGQ